MMEEAPPAIAFCPLELEEAQVQLTLIELDSVHTSPYVEGAAVGMALGRQVGTIVGLVGLYVGVAEGKEV